MDYSIGTVRKVFTNGVSGKAGQLLTAMRSPEPKDSTALASTPFSVATLDADALAEIRRELEEACLIVTSTTGTTGRPRIVSVPIWPLLRIANKAKKP